MVETLVTLQLMSYWFTVRKRPIYHHPLSSPCVVVKNLSKTLIRAQTELIVCDIPNPHHFLVLELCSQAIEMFQAAIDLDPRQYNAWWGLGDVFQRQEDFAQAKYNFLRALDINPSNQAFGLGEVD